MYVNSSVYFISYLGVGWGFDEHRGAVLSTAALTGILCLCCRTILWVQSVSLLAIGSMESCELLSAYFFMFTLMIWAMFVRVGIRIRIWLKFVSL